MRYVIITILLVLFTINYFMEGPSGISANFNVKLISYFNFLLFFSSIACIIQYFWPGDKNRTMFQLFNMLFALVFYCISFNYLVHHKDYYDGYSYLTDAGVLHRFAFRWDIFSIMFWFIVIAFFINILYLVRYREGTPVLD